jgi:hypothetical protein
VPVTGIALLFYLRHAFNKMDKINITSDKDTMRAKNIRLVITLEQNLDISECYECRHSSSKIG